MPQFSYTSKNFQGELKKGFLEAKNDSEAAKAIRQEGYLITDLKEIGRETEPKFSFSALLPFFNSVSLQDKLLFSRNLFVMQKAGISLPRSIKILAAQSRNKKFQKELLDISDEITKGETLSKCLEKRPQIFSRIYCSMIKVGEESGTMDESLKSLVSQMEKDHELKSKIKGALIYPAVIISAMFIIGLIMIVMVVPKLAQTFEELNIPLPVTTRFIIGFGNFLANFWFLIPFILLFLYIILKAVVRTQAGRALIDSIFLRLPGFSQLVKKSNSAYTARTLGSLISAGVPVVRSMELSADAMTNVYFKKAIIAAAEEVKKGAKIATSLSKYKKIYGPIVVEMIEIGEETGETAAILQKLAEFFEEEVANATKNLATIIEPALMMVVGAAVGFFAISMIQPMYGMLNAM